MKVSKIALIASALALSSTSVVSANTVNYSDTITPVIESITLNPSVVNVSTEGAILIATIVASDNLNNMNLFNGYLHPLYGANPQSTSDQALSTKVVNGRVQVTFQLKFVFKKGTPVGDYQIRATVYDAADNRLVAAGANMPGNSFKVVNDVASGPIDVTQFDYGAKLEQYLAQVQTLQIKINSIEKKLKAICSKKPKPKGC